MKKVYDIRKISFADDIIEKKNGKEALDYCRQIAKSLEDDFCNYPEVIFLDLHMAVMGGWEFLEKFSKEILPFFKDTKIVITSQSVDHGDSMKAKQYPFIIDLLSSPITVEYLCKLRESLVQGYIFHR